MAALPDAEKLCEQLAGALRAAVTPATAMVGIHTGGAWVAERLHAALGLQVPLGLLDPAFYRDDFARQGLARDPKRSKIPFEVEGKDLLLVDDVLYTGRTIRAAMNELFDYGRPQRIRLATLIDRGGRELPIAPQFVGAEAEVAATEQIELLKDQQGRLSLALRPRTRGEED